MLNITNKMENKFLRHNEILSLFDTMFEKKMITAFAGPIDSEILTLLAENLEGSLWQNASIGRKFFKIFIELSHNIYLYSEEREQIKGKESGAGIFIIRDLGESFLFTAGNMITKSDRKKLFERVNEINSLERDELRALKRKLRKKGNNKGGGNIGLVQVSLLAKNKLEIESYKTKNKKQDFFTISIKLQKN